MKNFLPVLFLTTLTLTGYCQLTQFTKESFNIYFKDHSDSLNPIEGLWDVSATQELYHHDTLYNVVKSPELISVAIIKEGDRFQSYNLSGQSFDTEFTLTDVGGVYLYRIFSPQTNQYSNTHAVICKSGEMEYTYDFPDKSIGAKPENTYEEGLRVVNILRWKKPIPAK